MPTLLALVLAAAASFVAPLLLVALALLSPAHGQTRGMDVAREVHCLAMNIYHEARGEPRVGMEAVAHVVMNRTRSPRFPDSVCGVVQQGGERPLHRCQFSWWCDGRSDRPAEGRAWERSVAVAYLVFWGHADDPTDGALWYHADYVRPSWSGSLRRTGKLGDHIFYGEQS